MINSYIKIILAWCGFLALFMAIWREPHLNLALTGCLFILIAVFILKD